MLQAGKVVAIWGLEHVFPMEILGTSTLQKTFCSLDSAFAAVLVTFWPEVQFHLLQKLWEHDRTPPRLM